MCKFFVSREIQEKLSILGKLGCGAKRAIPFDIICAAKALGCIIIVHGSLDARELIGTPGDAIIRGVCREYYGDSGGLDGERG